MKSSADLVRIGAVAHVLRQKDPDASVPWTYENLQKYDAMARAAIKLIEQMTERVDAS